MEMERSGVRVIGVDAPSAYEMAVRSLENHSQLAAAVVTAASGEVLGKKKRGRPRKYGANGTPLPISSSAPPLKKPARGRLNGLHVKMRKRTGFHISADGFADSMGTNFTPHIITVSAGEDVTMRVISFSQQGPRAICILSANGVISNVTLRQPDSSGGTLTYEGRFEILSLSGSFMPTEKKGTRGRSGGMSVSLASPDGRVVGGGVAGLLIAASPVQVVVGSFVAGGEQEAQQDHKPKKHSKVENMSSPAAYVLSSSEPDRDEDIAGNLHHPPPSSSFDIGGWTNGHHSSTSLTDINVSPQELPHFGLTLPPKS